MKHNFHTHTSRCQHAVGTDEAYVEAALDAGFDVLGFADHAPFPFANGFVSGIRMPLDQLTDYIHSVHALQQRYAGQLEIRLGLESEYFPRYHDHLLRMREQGIGYYILGQHYADSELSVESVCTHLHLSPAYFSTLFKRETGQSFTACVTEQRMNEAARLLRDTEEKTYLIAQRTGYADPNYFSYVFKRHFGVTPSKYRAGQT